MNLTPILVLVLLVPGACFAGGFTVGNGDRGGYNNCPFCAIETGEDAPLQQDVVCSDESGSEQVGEEDRGTPCVSPGQVEGSKVNQTTNTEK